MKEEKLNILKDLVVDENHSLEDLKRLVDKSKPFIKIENQTGNILISADYPFNTREKIIIFLIGIYFSKELGLNQDVQITSRYISENINVLITSMSGALGEYVKGNIVSKNDNSYSIKYYEIENQLDKLTDKYILNHTQSSVRSKPQKTKLSKKKTLNKRRLNIQSVKKIEKTYDEETLKNELAKYQLTTENLFSVINIVNNGFMLLRGWKGNSNAESHVKSTLIYLTVNKLIYDIDEVESSELRIHLIQSGVPMKNHSTTLKGYTTYIIHKRGPIGSTNTSYRITPLGFQKGLILLKDIIENTSNFDIPFKGRVKTEKTDIISISDEKLNQNISSFASENGMDEERLRTLFDFQNDGVRICMPLRESIRKIMQIKTLILLGGLLKKVYDVSNFSGKELLKNSRTSYDRLDLLDRNKHYQKYFSLNKSKSAMRLTYAGEKKAIKMIKEYLEKETCEL